MQPSWELFRCAPDSSILLTTRASAAEIASMHLAEVETGSAIHVVGAHNRWRDTFVHGSHVAVVRAASVWGKQDVSGLVAAIVGAHPLISGASATRDSSRYTIRVWLSLCNEAAIEVVLGVVSAFPGWIPCVVCHAPPSPGFSTAHRVEPFEPPFNLPTPTRTPESESLMQRRGIDGLSSIGFISDGRRAGPIMSPPTPMLDWTVTPSAKGSAPASTNYIASSPSSTQALKGGSPAWGSNVSPSSTNVLSSQSISPSSAPAPTRPLAPTVQLQSEPKAHGPQTTPSDSDPFISKGWAYPGGLNRKERRRIRFAMEEDPKDYPGAVFVGMDRPDGHLGVEEYTSLCAKRM